MSFVFRSRHYLSQWISALPPPLAGNLHRIAVRLFGVAGRLGHTRHWFDLAPLPLDDLL